MRLDIPYLHFYTRILLIMTTGKNTASHRLFVREGLTCAGHSYYITWLADYVIHDSHDTKFIPRLLERGKQTDQH